MGTVFGAALLDCSFADGAANLALNGLSTFLFVLPAASSTGRQCYSNVDQASGQVAIRKEFVAVSKVSPLEIQKLTQSAPRERAKLFCRLYSLIVSSLFTFSLLCVCLSRSVLLQTAMATP